MADDQIQREIEYRLIDLDGLERFSDTFEACYGVVAGERYFDWKYRQNPLGGMIGFEAVHRGRPIASYGAIPEDYYVAGETVRVYQSMDAMTHPDYQRRGLFGKLVELTYAHMLARYSEPFMIGVPGPMSHASLVKRLKWRDLAFMRTAFAPRAVRTLTKRIARPRALKFRYISELTPELVRYLERRPPPSRPITNRLSPSFFDWRVFQSPMRRFRVVQLHEDRDLLGVAVFSTDVNRRVLLSFVEFVPGADVRACMAGLIDELFQSFKAPMILGWEPMVDVLREAYFACGFLVNPWNKGPMSGRQPLIVRSESGKLNGVDWYNAENFELQPIMQD